MELDNKVIRNGSRTVLPLFTGAAFGIPGGRPKAWVGQSTVSPVFFLYMPAMTSYKHVISRTEDLFLL